MTLPRKFVMYLYNNQRQDIHITKLWRTIGSGHMNTHHTIKFLQRLGLIEKEKKGPKKLLRLTDRGKIVGQKLKEIEEILE
jgi:predicted transcriptional regulator